MKKKLTKFSTDDNIIFNPEKNFTEKQLNDLKPYQIFTRSGLMVDVNIYHKCDCEYCDHQESKTLFGKNMDELLQEYSEKIDEYDGVDDFELFEDKVKECFFVSVVHQESIDKSELI